MTAYNSKTYQIDGLTFDDSPKNHTFNWRSYDKLTDTYKDHKSNMCEYFKQKYNIRIREEGQPLLFVNVRDQVICLPPELCHEASLPENFTKDTFKMRDLQNYKISNPQQRVERISLALNHLQSNEIFEENKFRIEANMAKIKGKVLYPAKVLDDRQRAVDWRDYEQGKIRHAQPIDMTGERWAMVYSAFDFNTTTYVFEQFQKAQGRFGIRVQDPQWVEIPKGEDRKPKGQAWIDVIKSDIDPSFTTIAVVIIQKPDQKKYIKKVLDEMGVPSQFLLATKKLATAKIGVFSNILKQINAKVRQDLYRLDLPNLRGSMVVGVDVVNTGRTSILGFSATSNQSLSQHYSSTVEHDMYKDLIKKEGKDKQEDKLTETRAMILADEITKSLKHYQNGNKGNLPDQIVIYRDGLGGPSMEPKILANEVQYVLSAIQQFASGYNPRVLYVFVNKRITHRLFEQDNGNGYLNPGPGTVLD